MFFLSFPWFMVLVIPILYVFNKVRMFLLLKDIPRRKGNFFIGDTIYFRKIFSDETRWQMRMRCIKETMSELSPAKVLAVWVFWDPAIIVLDPCEVGKILSSTELLEKGDEFKLLKPWIGTGLLSSSHSKWRSRRKLLTPAFHFNALENFALIMMDLTRNLLQEWSEKKTQTIDFNKITSSFTLQVLFETVMGLPHDALSESRREYQAAISTMCQLFPLRLFSVFSKKDFLFQFTKDGAEWRKALETLNRFTLNAIDLRIAQILKGVSKDINLNTTGKQKKSLMDMLIFEYLNNNNASNLTLSDIQEEVATFMFAGHDTTAMALIWSVFSLGNNLQVQERLYEELSQTLDEKDFNVKTILANEYLDACIKESLRLFSSVPEIIRKSDGNLKIDGFSVPKGVTIVLPLFYLHRNPEIYPDPLKYDPNRFFNQETRPPFSFVPFSAGPRNCIGQKIAMMEIKIFIALLVMQFELRALRKIESAVYSFEATLKPKHPIMIELIRRN